MLLLYNLTHRHAWPPHLGVGALTLTRKEGIRSIAQHCINRLIALGLLTAENDLKAQDIVENYIENACDRLLAGEWENR